MSLSRTHSLTHTHTIFVENFLTHAYTQTKHMRAHYDLPMLVGLLNFTRSTFLNLNGLIGCWDIVFPWDPYEVARALRVRSIELIFHGSSMGKSSKFHVVHLYWCLITFLRNPFDAATCFSLIYFLLTEFNSISCQTITYIHPSAFS